MILIKEKNCIFTNRFVSIFSGDSSHEGSNPSTSTTHPSLLRSGPAFTIECKHILSGGDLVSICYTKVRRESKQLLNDNTLTKALALSAVAYSQAPETMVEEAILELA